ncbi:MAG: HesA/MoeB/ThiF family protein [Oscillospiraceae bacterium]|nr:HesA/MoeB/ThiF family protein [Oscillospiraceae bacterium]
MEERYSRNLPAVSAEEQAALAHKRVLVVGCGGLGGYLIEYLARMGVGEITAVDGDVFELSNLNRQLLSTQALLGTSKALAARDRVRAVNPDVRIEAIEAFLDEDNADGLVRGRDLVLDALDSAPARLILEDTCARAGTAIVHGAIQGWSVQVSVVPAGSGLLHRLYGSAKAPAEKTSLPCTPPFCAAVQAAEAVKLLCGRPSELEGKLLLADLRRMDWDILTI